MPDRYGLCGHVASPAARGLLLVGGSVVFGGLATVISGEFRIGWEFLLVDIPLAFGATVATMLIWSLGARLVVR
jgi:hypothetical protein